MRKPVVLGALASAVLGAGLAVVCILAGYWWLRDDRGVTFVDTYTERLGPDEPYNSSLSITFDLNWTALLVPAALGGAMAGLIVRFLLPRLRRRPASLFVGATALGAAVGVVGVLASYAWFQYETSGDGFERRYVDYLPYPGIFDWTGLLPPAAVAGAVLGLAVGAVAYAVVRRSARRAARSS